MNKKHSLAVQMGLGDVRLTNLTAPGCRMLGLSKFIMVVKARLVLPSSADLFIGILQICDYSALAVFGV